MFNGLGKTQPKLNTMRQKRNWIDALNELVRINYDRVSEYEKAIQDVENEDERLVTLFNHHASMSRLNVHGLRQLIFSFGGEPIMDPLMRGKLLWVWMDFKASLFGKDRKVVLACLETKELKVQQAYDDTLAQHSDFPYRIRLELLKQRQLLRSAWFSILDASLAQTDIEEILHH